MSITLAELRNLIDSPTTVVGDRIGVILYADDDYRFNVSIAIDIRTVEEISLIMIKGFSTSLKVSPDRIHEAYFFCNEYNSTNLYGKCYFDKSDNTLTYTYDILVGVIFDKKLISDLMQNVIATGWHFFVEAGRKF